jgi:hypothetical protein
MRVRSLIYPSSCTQSLIIFPSPISTYGQRGCGKSGLAKWQHSIVYVGEEEPDLLPQEIPASGESGMLSSIRVKPRKKWYTMFDSSRINYAKLYTVEHNVKVHDFGDVHSDSMSQLQTQWDYVLRCDLQGNPRPETAPLAAQPLPTVQEDPPALPVHGTAINVWNDTTREDQLMLDINDRVYVIEWADENWARGRNERTGYLGLFPRGYVNLDPPDYATALRDNKFDKKKPERLVFKRGDRILVKGYLNAGWDHGYNKGTEETGRFPYQWVKMDRGRFAIAIGDIAYDATKPDRLVFSTGDRILITYGDGTDWPRGRNERTRQEGILPKTYVKFE